MTIQESSLLLNNITQIDHAYIDYDGKPIGGSYNLSCLVSGKVDPTERVVVDFSKIKKSIKALIDDNAMGYDHKCWFIEGFSRGEYEFEDDRVIIKTPHTYANCVKDAIRVIKGGINQGHVQDVANSMASYLKVELEKIYGFPLDVEVELDTTPIYAPQMGKYKWHEFIGEFDYVHGLRNSSSYGCQNILHGHLSHAVLYTEKFLPRGTVHQIVGAVIDKILAGKILYAKENLVDETQCGISYSSNRGYFSMEYSEPCSVYPDETTIECIIEEVRRQVTDELKKVGFTISFGLYISEGLCKGAFVEVDTTV